MTTKELDVIADGIIKAIEIATAPLIARLSELERRVAGLQAQPRGLVYKGVWAPGEYQPGDCVSDHGSMWTAKVATTDRPGDERLGGERHWVLSVKRGRDGKPGARGPSGDSR